MSGVPRTEDGMSTLTVLGIVPLVGALLIGLVPRGRDLLVKQLALLTSLVVLVITIGMCADYAPGGARFQFTEVHDWVPAFGVQYAVGVDGIALVLIALIAVLVPVVLLASWYDADPHASTVAAPAHAGRAGGAAVGAGAAGHEGAGTGGSVALLERTEEGDDTRRPRAPRPRRRPAASRPSSS